MDVAAHRQSGALVRLRLPVLPRGRAPEAVAHVEQQAAYIYIYIYIMLYIINHTAEFILLGKMGDGAMYLYDGIMDVNSLRGSGLTTNACALCR